MRDHLPAMLPRASPPCPDDRCQFRSRPMTGRGYRIGDSRRTSRVKVDGLHFRFVGLPQKLRTGRGSFTPRHAGSSAQTLTPHTVIIADVDDPQWEYVITPSTVTFFRPDRPFDWTTSGAEAAVRQDRSVTDGDRDTWMVIDDKACLFAHPPSASPSKSSRSRRSGGRLRPAEDRQRVAHIKLETSWSY